MAKSFERRAPKRERKAPVNVTLTDTRVARLKVTGKLYRVWDDRVPGFHVQVTPAGAKSYRVQFERANGTKASVTIGSTRVWTAEKAQKRAADLRERHDLGKDIRAHVQDERAVRDVNALVAIWEENFKPKLKESSRRTYISAIKVIQKELGTRSSGDLSAKDVKALYRKATKGGHAAWGHKVIVVLSKLITIAEREDWRIPGKNPCRSLDLEQPKATRSRVFNAGEYATFEAALAGLVVQERLDPQAGDLFRFLALSGLRIGEAQKLCFADVDLERGVMTITDHKTAKTMGPKVLPLNTHLKVIVHRCSMNRLGQYLFAGWGKKGYLVGLSKMWARLMLEANIVGATPHDLRRSFMSVCTELGFPMSIGDTLLGHSLGKIRDTYVHLDSSGILATTSQETADWIAAAMAGQTVKPGVKVKKEEAVTA